MKSNMTKSLELYTQFFYNRPLRDGVDELLAIDPEIGSPINLFRRGATYRPYAECLSRAGYEDKPILRKYYDFIRLQYKIENIQLMLEKAESADLIAYLEWNCQEELVPKLKDRIMELICTTDEMREAYAELKEEDKQ